jgi:hypothetical protein
MATDIEKIRAIIRDKPLYDKQEIELDGVQLSIQVRYFPVVVDTVTVTGASLPASEIDADNGVIEFATAPDEQTVTVTYKHVNLLDEDIQIFLDLYTDSDIRLAAADAIDSIADEQALIQKKIKMLDLQTDGPALADSLRKHAKILRDTVASSDGEADFDVIEQVHTPQGYTERLWKEWSRESL